MSQQLVRYEQNDGIAVITMDDGKRNALSPAMFDALNEAFDRAEREEAAIILTGREDVFSAGFDLKVLRKGGSQTLSMLKLGYSMTARLLTYPFPVITASSGHAFAMGVFLMQSSDYRIGVQGDYTYSANEVAIGLPMPRVAAEVLKLRLRPADYQLATVLSQYYAPEEARQAGFLDQVVTADKLMDQAQEKAKAFLELDPRAHRITKERLRADVVRRIRRSIPLDLRDAVLLGVRTLIESRRG